MPTFNDHRKLRNALVGRRSRIVTLDNAAEIAIFHNSADQTIAVIDAQRGVNLAQFPRTIEPTKQLERTLIAVARVIPQTPIDAATAARLEVPPCY